MSDFLLHVAVFGNNFVHFVSGIIFYLAHDGPLVLIFVFFYEVVIFVEDQNALPDCLDILEELVINGLRRLLVSVLVA